MLLFGFTLIVAEDELTFMSFMSENPRIIGASKLL